MYSAVLTVFSVWNFGEIEVEDDEVPVFLSIFSIFVNIENVDFFGKVVLHVGA